MASWHDNDTGHPARRSEHASSNRDGASGWAGYPIESGGPVFLGQTCLLSLGRGVQGQDLAHRTPGALVAAQYVGAPAPEIDLPFPCGGELDQAARHPEGHVVP